MTLSLQLWKRVYSSVNLYLYTYFSHWHYIALDLIVIEKKYIIIDRWGFLLSPRRYRAGAQGTVSRLRTRKAGRCSGGEGHARVVKLVVAAGLTSVLAWICWVHPGVSGTKGFERYSVIVRRFYKLWERANLPIFVKLNPLLCVCSCIFKFFANTEQFVKSPSFTQCLYYIMLDII